jgi:4-alpha-glucanotransferase
MMFARAAGILLHPTSLPGRFGIGDLGPDAHRFVDALAEAGMRRWQILPLGPTGFGDSPYQCFSAFAGNPYLVSPEGLLEDGLLDAADLARAPAFPADRVDFGPVIAWKVALLERCWERFRAGRGRALRAPFDAFRESHAGWLDDFALFMALKEAHRGRAWVEWEAPLAARDPDALEAARARLAGRADAERFRQFLFFRQWAVLRAVARARGISIVGDVPIFVAHDSADVWAQPELFHLDARGCCTVVAGVPPDYFSRTGQRWGNPLYRWAALRRDGYAWWIARLRAVLEQVDVVRLDHFRGFEAYWEIPASATTAEKGRWVPGPGAELLTALRDALGALPIIAEDLGVITPGVLALRDAFGLPGMKVLQFAFGDGPFHPFLPHLHPPDCVVYTGTHDNDTTRGWYATAPEKERDFARRYLGRDGHDIAWDLIRAAFASVARTAIVPMQDVLDLGTEARMNLPGRPEGNWTWRFTWDRFSGFPRERLLGLASLYARLPEAAPRDEAAARAQEGSPRRR